MKKLIYLDFMETINSKFANTPSEIILIDNNFSEMIRTRLDKPIGVDLDCLAVPKAIINSITFPLAMIRSINIVLDGIIYSYSKSGKESSRYLDSNENIPLKNFNANETADLGVKINSSEESPLLKMEALNHFNKNDFLTDTFEEIFLDEIRKVGKEGYYIELCHYNYTRTFLYIDHDVELLPTKVYAKFRDDYEDRVLYVALVKYKDGVIKHSRKKSFKAPCYHIEYAVDLMLSEIKSLKKLYDYFNGLKVEASLIDRTKVAWEHKLESTEVINSDDSFDFINEYKSILSHRRGVKDVNSMYCSLSHQADFKNLMSINLDKLLIALQKTLKMRQEKIISAKEEWGRTSNKLIVIKNDLLQDNIYNDIIDKYNKNAYDPYTERLVAYTTVY